MGRWPVAYATAVEARQAGEARADVIWGDVQRMDELDRGMTTPQYHATPGIAGFAYLAPSMTTFTRARGWSAVRASAPRDTLR